LPMALYTCGTLQRGREEVLLHETRKYRPALLSERGESISRNLARASYSVFVFIFVPKDSSQAKMFDASIPSKSAVESSAVRLCVCVFSRRIAVGVWTRTLTRARRLLRVIVSHSASQLSRRGVLSPRIHHSTVFQSCALCFISRAPPHALTRRRARASSPRSR
jgi:hypothetical protein